MLRKFLFVCGILAALLYVGSDLVAGMRWEGYSLSSQSISELRAIGAPTRPFLVPILALYSLCELAFGWGVWQTAGANRRLRIAGLLLMGLGLLDVAGPLFPMHLRGATGSLTDALHITVTIITVLLILLIIGFGATADGKLFRVYSLLTLLTLIVTGVWAGMDGPRIAANLPTPWLGVRERINVYGYMLWLAVLAVVLLRRAVADQTHRTDTRDTGTGGANRPTSHLTPA